MLWFAALLLAQSAPQTQCAAMDANLPAPLAGWATPGHGSPDNLSKPVTFAGVDPARIPGLPANAKPGQATAVQFSVDNPGIYGIAADKPVWIDVAPLGGPVLKSASHGHGPECSTIRKIVRFELRPGTYMLYLSGITTGNVKVMLVAPE